MARKEEPTRGSCADCDPYLFGSLGQNPQQREVSGTIKRCPGPVGGVAHLVARTRANVAEPSKTGNVIGPSSFRPPFRWSKGALRGRGPKADEIRPQIREHYSSRIALASLTGAATCLQDETTDEANAAVR